MNYIEQARKRFRARFFELNPAECVSPENNGQPEQDDCDRHERRTGDVSEQDEEDRDDGEDCCDVVVHSFPVVGLRTLPCEVIWGKILEQDRFRVLEWSRGNASDIERVAIEGMELLGKAT